ncbi:MAG: formate dehydrogenase family accessory protein FdhD [Thermodesulfobacterium geofontis]|uniref:Sulfur carrier protein FdhD n=1 Tax=Thermodesulfobacterium geofontis TaxID=1295609 RepID=A0A2N7PQI9_9BACT|nr:MAG: formate dehydrogenase family accessory protein FdhD [Thermodesulfobacterium geofontis]
MKSVIHQKIIRIKENRAQVLEDFLAVETKIKILINDEEIISLFATPLYIKELVVGFILTENIIKGDFCPKEIEIIEEEEIRVKVYSEGFLDLSGKTLTSGCMSSFSFINELPEKYEDNFKIEKENLFSLFKDFQKKSELYKITGCVHYAALADQEKIVFIAEDIGRHNAVDKVLGYAFLNKLSLEDKILLVSGRISSEMVLKAGRWKIPIIVSRSAPTSLAVKLAENIGLTVIGFLRGNRCNIYTSPYRINL